MWQTFWVCVIYTRKYWLLGILVYIGIKRDFSRNELMVWHTMNVFQIWIFPCYDSWIWTALNYCYAVGL